MGVVNWHNLCRINLELSNKTHWGLLGGTSGKEPACQCRRHKGRGLDPWVRKIPWRRACQPTPVFLPGGFHEQRSLVGYSPWSHKESDMTERLSTHTPRSDIIQHCSVCTQSPQPFSLGDSVVRGTMNMALGPKSL